VTEVAPLVVAITGASGAPYALKLLQSLIDAKRSMWLIVSEHGKRLLATETDVSDVQSLRARLGANAWDRLVTVFDDTDRGASPASGSARTTGMVVCPCSMATLAAVAAGSSRSLVERAADVALKERRKVVLVTRETPLSEIHLRNMLRVTHAGAVVLPASPGFYSKPTKIDDLVSFIVARVLDQLGVEHELARRWSSGARIPEP
jgi:flavin prenyltransferase